MSWDGWGLLLVVGEAIWIVAGTENMSEFAALKLSALIGVILPTVWFATLGGQTWSEDAECCC